MSPSPAAPAADAALAVRLLTAHRKRVLDPIERFSEIIFGLVMVLTFTGSISVAGSGRQEVRDVLVAALGCNVAWGIVDGVMYVIASIVQRARLRVVVLGVRAAGPEAARALVREALPPGVALVTGEEEVARMVERARDLPEPRAAGIELEDLRGALGSCLLVVAATFPPTIPFLVVEDVGRALRISNAVAVGSLFLAGWSLGKATGVRGWLLGGAMVFLGAGLVALTVALGG